MGFWLREYAPEDFKFSLNEESPLLDLTDNQRVLIERLVKVLDEKWDNLDGKGLQEEIYSIKNELEMEPSEVFSILYNVLISKNQGPRLANFILSIPKYKVMSLLSGVIR